MTTKIINTKTSIFTEDKELLNETFTETFLLEASFGKLLKHVPTNKIIGVSVCESLKFRLKDYIEIDDPKASK